MAFLAFLVLSASVASVQSTGFLSGSGNLRVDANSFQNELTEAMGTALGCGGQVGEKELERIEEQLLPVWKSLHKNAESSIDRRSLRYLVHRYFDRRSALHIRGFEPSRTVNSSSWGDVDILSQKVPAYVESVLESNHRAVKGFNLRDAAHMVATVQQLVLDSEGSLLEKAFRTHRMFLDRSLVLSEVRAVLEAYLVHWFVGDDEESVSILLSNQSLLEASIPHWSELVSMAEGHAKALEYIRQSNPLVALRDSVARPGHNAFASRFSFDDLHGVVGSITTSFASFWESECQSMKNALVSMDSHNTGRVPLSKFYASAIDTEWRFGESESYLRELGALDESGWNGKQVIIANYIQGASNCIVSSTHYLVCCVNECEALQGELEVAIGAPSASPRQILDIAVTLTNGDEHLSLLQGPLPTQLEQIASTHAGTVPLHGRLFAQWLHYAFPRECPFPHKAGAAAKLTPMEFGDEYLAQGEDMRRHAQEANASNLNINVSRDDLQWMSQWSAEEELVSDQVMRGFRAPWEGRSTVASGAMLLLVAGALSAMRTRSASSSKAAEWTLAESKSHFV